MQTRMHLPLAVLLLFTCATLPASDDISHDRYAYFLGDESFKKMVAEYDRFMANDKDADLFEAGLFLGYVDGVMDTMVAKKGLCIPKNINRREVSSIAAAGIKVDMEKFGAVPAGWSVSVHLIEAFPCPKSKASKKK